MRQCVHGEVDDCSNCPLGALCNDVSGIFELFSPSESIASESLSPSPPTPPLIDSKFTTLGFPTLLLYIVTEQLDGHFLHYTTL